MNTDIHAPAHVSNRSRCTIRCARQGGDRRGKPGSTMPGDRGGTVEPALCRLCDGMRSYGGREAGRIDGSRFGVKLARRGVFGIIVTMPTENIIKFRCPYCSGKVAVDLEYYAELVGKVINCPHCAKEMIIPATIDPAKQNAQGIHGMDVTQEIKMPEEHHTARSHPAAEGTRHCPHCGVEVGKRDRICITCGNRIPLPEPPSGFSQIRA